MAKRIGVRENRKGFFNVRDSDEFCDLKNLNGLIFYNKIHVGDISINIFRIENLHDRTINKK